MKKFLVLMVALCLAIPTVCAVELTKKEQKTVEKLASKRAKEYAKDGWKTMGALPLEQALAKYYTATEYGNCTGISGESTRTKSKNNGRLLAQSNAMNLFVASENSELKGRIIQDMKANGIDPDEGEFENFYAAFERLAEGSVQGELQEAYSLIREYPDGTFEIQTVYLIDKEAASKNRIRAIKNAMKESEMAQQYAEKVSEFIDNGNFNY